jgi:hypothetical protein
MFQVIDNLLTSLLQDVREYSKSLTNSSQGIGNIIPLVTGPTFLNIFFMKVQENIPLE